MNHNFKNTVIMKTKLLSFFLLVMLFQVSIDAFSMEMNTSQKIDLKGKKMQHSHRSMPLLPTAFIDGSLLSINFPSVANSVTITVKNEETGEIVYSSIELNATALQIDLTGENTGKYSLEISFGETILSGDFIL